MLALVVGVAGLVVVLVLGFTLLNVNDLVFDYYSPGTFSCYIQQNAAYPKAVSVSEMEQLARDNPEIFEAVSPLISSSDLPLNLRNGDKVYEDASLYGVGEGYMAEYNGVHIQEGRFLQSMDIAREQKVCVLGKDIADALFDGNALGETVKIWGINYRVVGVLSDSYFANYELLIPYTNAGKMFGEDIRTYNENNFHHDQYIVVANGSEHMREARQLIEDLLCRKTGGENGSVYEYGTKWTLSTYAAGTVKEIMKGGVFAYIYSLLLVVGFVLLISCAGIMNIMLASVQERTKEIGIRRAFGANRQDIKKQFTLEAVATSLIGGALGVALGLAAVVLMAFIGVVLPINAGYQVCFEDMSWLSLGLPVLLALAVSVGVGVISATYPAQQATKLEIVDCISE